MKGINTYMVGGKRSVTYLLFMDYILCFTCANEKSFTTIERVVDDFLIFSNLHVNARKIMILFSISCEGEQEELQVILSYDEGRYLPLKYLNVSLVWRDLCMNDYLPLMQ